MSKDNSQAHLPLPFFKWRGFTIRVFLFTIIPVLIIVLGIVFFSQYLHLREMRMMVGDRNLRSIRLAADAIAYQFKEKQDFLLLYEKTASNFSDSAIIFTYFDQGVAVYDSKTQQIQPISAHFPLDTFNSDWITSWKLLPEFTPSAPLTINFDDSPQTLIAIRSGQDKFLVGVFDSTSFFENSLHNLLSAASVSVWVEDINKNLIYSGTTGKPQDLSPMLDFSMNDNHQGMDGIEILPARNGDQVISYAPVSGSDWWLVYEETWGNVATSLINTTFYTPFILIPVIVIAVIALWFGARQIVIPLQKLQKQSLLLGQGDFAAIEAPVGGIEEIKQLQQQLILVSHELQMAEGNLHQFIGSLTAGVEKERQNLARELHDDTLQSLIALQQKVQMAELKLDHGPVDNMPDLLALKDLVQKSIINLRRLVRGLRPAYLDDFGLVSATRILIEEMRSNQEMQIEMFVDGQEKRLPPNVELAFYRIIQEALTNAIRHSQANQIKVVFSFSEMSTSISIEDNGQGFTIPKQIDGFASKGHFGLLGMSERADIVGAILGISSIPQHGTRINLSYSSK